uniref:DUF4276 domain-containing protein n=1 Tax=Candidatus Kentrum sp. UNK TaxID=2126344 RepID=A0A451AKB3_9GAMM|nr:MAG: protein of unknown function (DUF4276) [Candidatus Kentron sp. UNK]VFK71683.1 MAG: protein of unknown function (DUF4276) [Candidatus Kentron sp. UNK]
MKELVFFLEEPSTREMMKGVLSRLLPDDIAIRYVVFEGKQDLHKRLPGKLQGWIKQDARFVVLRDQDRGNCIETKRQLSAISQDAGKDDVLIRIACHELESWYLGDLDAVEKGLGVGGIAKNQDTKKYRDPDRLTNPFQELNRLTKQAYQKVSGSRNIGPHLSLKDNCSHSFMVFISGIRRLIEGA